MKFRLPRINPRIVIFYLLVFLISGSPAESQVRLKIMTYNIRHGEGMDTKIDLNRIAAVIRDHNPDLVALQEVDRGVNRSKNRDQPKLLSDQTGLKTVFERNIFYDGGDYGNAVLSRFSIISWENHYLPAYRKGEQRGVLEVWVAIPGIKSPVRFLATHLDYREDDTERMASAAFIDSLVMVNPAAPSILAGDLNDRPESQVLKTFGSSWKNVGAGMELPTYPAPEPRKQIDYILVRPGDKWSVIKTEVIAEKRASDHRPLIVILELKTE